MKSGISAAVQSLGYGSVLFLCSRTLPSLQKLRKHCLQLVPRHCNNVHSELSPPTTSPCCQSVISCYSCNAAGNAALKGYSQNLHFFISIDTTNILKEQLVIGSFLTFCYLPPGKCTHISMQIPGQSLLLLNTNYNL